MAAVCDLPLTYAHLSALGELGYHLRGYNEPWWAFLRKGMPRTHHLHIIDGNNGTARDQWERQVLFRDYLRGLRVGPTAP